MLVIFGTKAYVSVLATVMAVCTVCGNPAAQRVDKRVTKFTLFFLPLFPVSTRYTVQCAMCGATTRLDEAEAERRASGPTRPGGSSVSDAKPQRPAH